MLTEWISIENNRYRVTKKTSRLSKLLETVLDLLDQGLYKKLKDILNLNNNNNDSTNQNN